MQLEVNWQRQMPRDQRARRRSPRKMLRRARFPHRTSDSDWKANCRRQRRISCPSCFRSRTYCSALPYSKIQVTRSPCSTLPYGKRRGMRKGRTGVRLRLRLRKERPLRDVAAASAAPDPCLTPPFPATRSPAYPAPRPPRLATLGLLRGLGCGSLASRPASSRGPPQRCGGVGGQMSGRRVAETTGWPLADRNSESPVQLSYNSQPGRRRTDTRRCAFFCPS
jgi:hypothetical protein